MTKREEIEKFRTCSLPFYKNEVKINDFDKIFKERVETKNREKRKIIELRQNIVLQENSIEQLKSLLKVKEEDLKLLKEKLKKYDLIMEEKINGN